MERTVCFIDHQPRKGLGKSSVSSLCCNFLLRKMCRFHRCGNGESETFSYFLKKKDDFLLYACFLEFIGKHLNATSFIFFTTKISVKGIPKIIPISFQCLKSLTEQVADETIAFDAVIFAVKKVGFLCVTTTNL